MQLEPSKRNNAANKLHPNAATNKHTATTTNKTYNSAGDVEHHSHKDITSTIQPKEHNVTSVKRWDILQKLCRSKMPERPRQRPTQRTLQQSYNQSPGKNQTRRFRHVTEQSQDVIQATTEDENKSIDPESTLYLKELTEDWVNINLVKPKSYRPERNIIVNKTQKDEIWIQTTCNNSEKIEWLADTGSPRSFINQSTAKKLMSNNLNIKIKRYNENKRYRCFNNKGIKIKGVIHMDITSGNWIAKNCQILIVEQNTTNLMGRDMLPKLGISLQQTKQQDKQKLKHPALPREAMWDFDEDSEPELDIQYKEDKQQNPAQRPITPDSSVSENAPLIRHTLVPEEQAARASTIQPCRPNPINTEPLGHADVVKMARANQRKQAPPTRAKQNPKGETRKSDQKRATAFAQNSKEAALKHSQSVRNDKRKLLYSSSSENKSLIKASPKQLQSSSTMKIFNIRETPGGPILRITAYSDAINLMNSPSTSAATPGPSQARSTPQVDRIVDNNWERNSPKKQPENDNPIEVVYLDSSNSTGKQTHDIIHLESTPDDENDTVQKTSN